MKGKAILAYMVSLFWQNRNERLFQAKSSQPINLFRWCMSISTHICMPSSFSPSVTKFLLRNWGLSVLRNQHFLPSNLISWRPPTLGTFMLNFDGVVRSNNATASYIIRDHNGLLLAAGGKRLVVKAWDNWRMAGSSVSSYPHDGQKCVHSRWFEGDFKLDSSNIEQ